jgi:hypothetical protein
MAKAESENFQLSFFRLHPFLSPFHRQPIYAIFSRAGGLPIAVLEHCIVRKRIILGGGNREIP